MQVEIQKSTLNARLLFTKPLKIVQFQNPKSKNEQIEVVKSLKDMSIKQRSILMETYKTVFKEPHYEEFFTNKEVFENFNKISKNKNATLLTLKNGDEILGFISGYEKSKNTFWIEELGILPQNQRSGNGSKLIDSITDYATKLGYCNLSLKTSIYNEKGINFYKKKGFLLTNKTILVPTNKIQMTTEENVEKLQELMLE